MKITEVTAEYGLVVNDGNYGSERIAIELKAVLEPAEVPDEAYYLLIDMARQGVRHELAKSRTAEVRRRVAAVEVEEDEAPF